jgi:geranylgeranyl pyrophosphate synthase
MHYLTLSQAAKEVGKSKGTLSKDLKTGKISYVEKSDAGYKIDPAELFRVYPKNRNNTDKIEQFATHMQTGGEVALMREMLEREREINKELRKDLAAEREERQTLALRLEHVTKRKKFLGVF